MKTRFYRSKQQGFSLVELLVSVVIGLLLVVGVLQAFISSKETYTLQSGLAKLQENGRFAMAFLTRDLRQAGYSGCTSNTTFANTLRDASGALPSYLDFDATITGVDNLGAGVSYNTISARETTDVVEVRFADNSNSCDVDFHNVNSANMHCTDTNPFNVGDLLVVTNCTHTALFQKTGPAANNQIIVHNTGNGVDIGNCTKGLGVPVECTTNGTGYQFSDGIVLQLNFYRYFIGTNTHGEPSLYRQSIQNNAGVTGTASSELVEGIENMQVLYGEDTDSDGTADYYVPFDEVADDENIISIRVSILVRSSEDSIARDGQTVAFNGTTTTFNDGRLRKVFTTTIALRNRL